MHGNFWLNFLGLTILKMYNFKVIKFLKVIKMKFKVVCLKGMVQI